MAVSAASYGLVTVCEPRFGGKSFTVTDRGVGFTGATQTQLRPDVEERNVLLSSVSATVSFAGGVVHSGRPRRMRRWWSAATAGLAPL